MQFRNWIHSNHNLQQLNLKLPDKFSLDTTYNLAWFYDVIKSNVLIRNQSSSFGRSPNRNWIIRIFFLILGFLTNLFEKSFTLSRNHNLRMRNKIKCFVKDFRIKVLQDTDFCFFTYWCTPFSYFIPFADKISKAAWRKKKEKNHMKGQIDDWSACLLSNIFWALRLQI